MGSELLVCLVIALAMLSVLSLLCDGGFKALRFVWPCVVLIEMLNKSLDELGLFELPLSALLFRDDSFGLLGADVRVGFFPAWDPAGVCRAFFGGSLAFMGLLLWRSTCGSGVRNSIMFLLPLQAAGALVDLLAALVLAW